MISLTSLFGKDAAITRETDFQVLLLVNILGPLGSGIVSPVLNSLTDPFGVSAADIGLMISVFTAPAIVMIPLMGMLTDRYGRKPILVFASLLYGIAGAGIAFTTDFRVVLALRLLQGVGFAGIVPVLITSIGDMYDGSREATAQGIRFTGSGVTQAVFPLLAGILVVFAWQYPLLLYAVAIPIALIVYLWFTEPTDADVDPSAVEVRDQLHALAGLVRQRRVFAMVIARGLPVAVWIGFLTYNSVVVVEVMGGTPAQAGGLVAVSSLAYAGAASQAGRITAMFDSRLYPLIGANLALTAGFAVMLFAPTLGIAAVGIGLAGAGFGLVLSLYRSIITGLATQSLRGSLVSLAEAFGRVTATATPIAMGAAIAVLTQPIGFAAAVQWAGLAVGIIGGVGGAVCMIVVSLSPPVRHDPLPG